MNMKFIELGELGRNPSPVDIRAVVRCKMRSTYVDIHGRPTFIICGKPGPTGKTWLRNQLRALGWNAVELPMDATPFITYNDDENHIIQDNFENIVVVILNERRVTWEYHRDIERCLHEFRCPICGSVATIPYSNMPIEAPKSCCKCGAKHFDI